MSTTIPRAAAAGTDARTTEEIEVIASDGVDEIDQALAIVHDGFVEAGYVEPQGSGRRMHRSYLNPGTVFFVARMGGEAVGTCALIADGPFGLPSDRAFVEENDAMRREGAGPLHECGSLAVSSHARRHTRRIMIRLIAAMSRIAFAEFPTSPVPLAVAPESRRFYEAMVGARLVAEPRLLYDAPAVLLRTSGAGVVRHSAQDASSLQRRMHALLDEPDPSWLTDRRTRSPLPEDWLRGLLDEEGVVDDLAAQIALLTETYPAAVARIIRRAALEVAA